MELSAVTETFQPVALLVCRVGTAARAFNYSMRFEPKIDDYRQQLLPVSTKLLAGILWVECYPSAKIL